MPDLFIPFEVNIRVFSKAHKILHCLFFLLILNSSLVICIPLPSLKPDGNNVSPMRVMFSSLWVFNLAVSHILPLPRSPAHLITLITPNCPLVLIASPPSLVHLSANPHDKAGSPAPCSLCPLMDCLTLDITFAHCLVKGSLLIQFFQGF